MLGRLGIWIDRLDKCGSWEDVVTQACKSGISWIVIKAGDAYRNNQFGSDVIADRLAYAHSSGLEVFTWNNSRPQTWTAEVHMIEKLSKEGVDGHIIVPSNAWQGQSIEAARFTSSVKRKVHDSFVGFSVEVSHANSFPVDQFLVELDGFYPVLNGELKSSLDAMTKLTSGIGKRNIAAVKPVFPVIGTRGPEELSKALNAFEGVPVSLGSWEQLKDTNVFAFLERLQNEGLLTLDVAEVEIEKDEQSPDTTQDDE